MTCACSLKQLATWIRLSFGQGSSFSAFFNSYELSVNHSSSPRATSAILFFHIPRRRLKATEYTAGWVCALPIELAAAQAILDEEYEGLPVDDYNSDCYTFGRIGCHNIVIVCLPAGRIGIAPAAASAVRMLSTFKSIRYGMMVGIGGGVPSAEADIRLGDVVVSQPSSQHGGVVQYDAGKTGRGGRFTRTGSLNTPPTLLLNAISQLRATQYRIGTDLTSKVGLFGGLPQFNRDAAGPDILFEAAYQHSGGATCEQCDKHRLVHRPTRRIEDQVTIHYGTIASGNQVMKDGTTRDRLSKELGGVLCYEMEAAGLMNDFPCLVVRGICDYADAHKNKAWQPYAAATAAACAKEILLLVPVVKVSAAEIAETFSNYHIPFSLKNVPVGKFADRPQDMEALERALLPQKQTEGRRTLVMHGLGGMGKTQLAVTFVRRHQKKFSSVLWLDGSGKSSLKQSIASFANCVPKGQIPETSRLYADGNDGDIDMVVKDMLGWLSNAGNSGWLVVLDNVDRDYQHQGEDAEAYAVDEYLPEADHGSVLITTRLPRLGKLGERWEVKKVGEEQARAVFETWFGKSIGEHH